jgi:hypothetical protein
MILQRNIIITISKKSNDFSGDYLSELKGGVKNIWFVDSSLSQFALKALRRRS